MVSKPTEFTDIPNGRYKGTWSGRKVVVQMPDNTRFEFYTKDGVLGFDIPCKITVIENDVVVETI